MKRILTAFISEVLSLLLLTGCGGKEAVASSAQGTSAADSAAAISDTVSEEDRTPSSESSESMTDEDMTSSATDSGMSSVAEEIKAADETGTAAVQPNAEQDTASAGTSTEPTESAPSASTSPSSSTSSTPSASQPAKPQENSSSAATSSETESKAESSAPSMPVIDIDYYINYAIAYGQSIGLIYLPGQSESWNAPTIINGYNREVVEQEIRDGLNFKKNVDGWLYFHVWAVQRADGKYELYGI